MDFSSELAWRGPHVCWPCLLHMWLRGQFCDCEVFKVFAKLHILRWVFLWPCSTGTSTWSPRRLAGSSTSSSPGVRKSGSVLNFWYAGSSPSVVFSPPCSTGRACSTCWTASRSGPCPTSEPPLMTINMVKIIMIAIPRFVPQFSVTLAACLLFILGAFKSAAITPPVRSKKQIWGRWNVVTLPSNLEETFTTCWLKTSPYS